MVKHPKEKTRTRLNARKLRRVDEFLSAFVEVEVVCTAIVSSRPFLRKRSLYMLPCTRSIPAAVAMGATTIAGALSELLTVELEKTPGPIRYLGEASSWLRLLQLRSSAHLIALVAESSSQYSSRSNALERSLLEACCLVPTSVFGCQSPRRQSFITFWSSRPI